MPNPQMGRVGIATRFKPGRSGNPGGKPRGFSRLIRDRTDDGMLLFEEAFQIITDREVQPNVRLEALKFLAEHAYGRPGQAEVEWDEERVRAFALEYGRDPDEAARNFRLMQGGQA